MTTPRKLVWRGQVERRADAVGLILGPCDAVLVLRSRPRLVLLGCPCGCRAEIVVNVDSELEGSWRVYRSRQGVSLYPSVWRDDGCGSHFIIWNDQVFLFGGGRTNLDEDTAIADTLEERVLAFVQARGRVHYVDIADALGEVPWAALRALRVLERRGLVTRLDVDEAVYEMSPQREG